MFCNLPSATHTNHSYDPDKLEMVGRYTPAAGGNFGFKAITK